MALHTVAGLKEFRSLDSVTPSVYGLVFTLATSSGCYGDLAAQMNACERFLSKQTLLIPISSIKPAEPTGFQGVRVRAVS